MERRRSTLYNLHDNLTTTTTTTTTKTMPTSFHHLCGEGIEHVTTDSNEACGNVIIWALVKLLEQCQLVRNPLYNYKSTIMETVFVYNTNKNRKSTLFENHRGAVELWKYFDSRTKKSFKNWLQTLSWFCLSENLFYQFSICTYSFHIFSFTNFTYFWLY